MKPSLTLLLALLASTSSLATEYGGLITNKNPVVYLSHHAGYTNGSLGVTPKHVTTLAPLRGINGLAGAYSRSAIRGNTTFHLNETTNNVLTQVLNTSFTIEFWFLDQAPAPNNSINYSVLYKAEPRSFTRNSLWIYRKRQDGHFMFTLQSNTDRILRLEIKNPSLNKPQSKRSFHHMAITVKRGDQGAQATAYLDAEEVAKETFSGEITFNNNGPLIIGNNHHKDSPWEGRLDELAIYSAALSPKTLQQHHQAGRAVLTTKTVLNPTLQEKEQFFEANIRPILIERCSTCHSGEAEAESSLSVLSLEALLRGGEYGPSIIAYRAEDSLLIAAIQKTHKELRMPPDVNDQLTRDEIKLFYKWINDGAVWPNSSETAAKTLHNPDSHTIAFDPEIDWAFRPRQTPTPPPVKDQRWNQNVIDRFVHTQRIAHGLTATPHASRRTLIRRASLDLTGLPPTIAEVTAFTDDPANLRDAFAKVIDRLLTSPRYGERQGRLWLDVARYADTQGDVGDIPIHSAYLYRNWVINALNNDMPYNTFLQAQLAGDILAARMSNSEDAKGYNVATGFISLSRRFGNRREDSLHMTIEDTLDTIGRGIMGLTLRCARCHDHKFDPIPTADYYGFYGIFRSTEYPWMGMSDQKAPFNLNPHDPLNSSSEEAQEYWRLINRYEYQVNNHFRPWLKPTLDAFKQTEKQLKTEQAKLVVLTNAGQLNTDQAKTIQKTIVDLEAMRETQLAFRSGAFRELMLHGLQWLKDTKDKLGDEPPYQFVFSVREGDAADSAIHLRGNPETKGPVVPRHFLSTITPATKVKIEGGSGRLELANWLTQDDHPLTPRVIVNRIWAQHFGRGIVESLDNFGRQGKRPTHPELLDWLTQTFVDEGWSLKQLHRRIMLTATYQLSSLDESKTRQTQDPGNVWLWRHSRQRLDAESIRDSILFTSGQLNTTQPGAHPLAPWYKTRYNLNNPFHQEYDHNHRSVYLITQRIFRHSMLGLFDSPDTNSSTSERNTTNVPAQALFLMNSKFIAEQAQALAVRMVDAKDTKDEQIRWLFQVLFAREISPGELQEIKTFLQTYQTTNHVSNTSPETQRREYQALCRVLLTSNEFFFID